MVMEVCLGLDEDDGGRHCWKLLEVSLWSHFQPTAYLTHSLKRTFQLLNKRSTWDTSARWSLALRAPRYTCIHRRIYLGRLLLTRVSYLILGCIARAVGSIGSAIKSDSVSCVRLPVLDKRCR